MGDLQRFLSAQDDAYSGFAEALAEIRSGRKQGHWIWYVFPQLAGLGRSHDATFYGLSGAAETADYLRDPVLRERLLTIASAVAERTRGGERLTSLMNSRIDALKLVSSMTLFGAVAARLQASEPHDDYARLAAVAEEILSAGEAEGYPRCPFTRDRLGMT